MNSNLRALLLAAERSQTSCRVLHPTGNVVLVGERHLFVNWSTPIVSHAVSRLCTDKDYCWHLLSPFVPMPRSEAYLFPQVEARFQEYVQYGTVEEILAAIKEGFGLPVIIKRNSGAHGNHVYRCESEDDVCAAVMRIFGPGYTFDYLLLAQEYIQIKGEYRLVCLHSRVNFAYEKDISEATFQGNLSPLHWQGARARLLEEGYLLSRLEAFVAPIFKAVNLPFAGLDVVIDEQDKMWLLEVNTSPGFDFFIRDNGPERVVSLYREMLAGL